MLRVTRAGTMILFVLLATPVFAEEAAVPQVAAQEVMAPEAATSQPAATGPGAQPAQAPEQNGQPQQGTYTVTPGPLKIELTFNGIFTAAKTAELSREPKVWPQMRAVWAVEPGTSVKKGDVLVKLDTADLDQKIADLESERPLGLIVLKQTQQEAGLMEKGAPEQLAAAERAAKIAAEDLKHYEDTDVAYFTKDMALSQRGIDLWLDNAEMELSELKRMYNNEDLVENTEKLVLKRQQFEVDQAELAHEKWTKYQRDWTKTIEQARELEGRQKQVRDAELNFEQTKVMLPIMLERKKQEAKKLEYDRGRAALDLQKLKEDRAGMEITAPMEGLVYYGRCVRGQWVTAEDVGNRLLSGGPIAPGEVFMTIVAPSPLAVKAAVPENVLSDLKEGMAAKCTATGYARKKLDAKISAVKILAAGAEPYSIELAVDDVPKHILPGMTCEVKLPVYEKKDAVLVPAAAVFAEPADDEARYVYVKNADGKAVKRPVKVGRTKDDKLEIRDGLSKGDVILLEEPAE